MKKVKSFILREWFPISIGMVLTVKAVQVAYNQRGVFALGGECLVLPVVVLGANILECLLHTIAWIISEEKAEKEAGKHKGSDT